MNDKKKETPKTHDDLKGFDIKINEFGEIISSYSVDKINSFLDDKVEDKKLSGNEEEEE
jgi:hypothetical protein